MQAQTHGRAVPRITLLSIRCRSWPTDNTVIQPFRSWHSATVTPSPPGQHWSNIMSELDFNTDTGFRASLDDNEGEIENLARDLASDNGPALNRFY